jgi:hypothetical protein
MRGDLPLRELGTKGSPCLLGFTIDQWVIATLSVRSGMIFQEGGQNLTDGSCWLAECHLLSRLVECEIVQVQGRFIDREPEH